MGTSSAKAVVFTDQGEVVGEGRARTPWITTSYGVELAAEELLKAAVESLGAALDATPGTATATVVGITSMGESGVLVDRDGTPVAPVIAWHDSRDHEDFEALRLDIAADTFAATTGKPLSGQWATTKHRWLLRNIPSAATAVRRFNIAEWVVRGLGGDEVSELALACRTGWFDLSRRDWWLDGLAWSGQHRISCRGSWRRACQSATSRALKPTHVYTVRCSQLSVTTTKPPPLAWAPPAKATRSTLVAPRRPSSEPSPHI